MASSSEAALAPPAHLRRDAVVSSHSQTETPRSRYMAPLCAVLGATSHGLFNSLRRRPAMYQPWWHVILGTVGWLGGDYLGRLYDSTGDELNRQYQSVGRLPSWMHGKLSEEELNAERRRELAAEFKHKWNQLALLEEKEFLEKRKASKEAEVK